MSWKLSTTFDFNDLCPYFETLTKARPDINSKALWYRSPETLKQSLKSKKDELIEKTKQALKKTLQERRSIVKEVFIELLDSLKTWFTKQQLKQIIENFDKFNDDLIIPISHLKENDYLFEEYHWPTDAFKDIALQMVTSMVSVIVEEENKKAIEKAKNWEEWQTLKFVITQTSTSGDTWPAWWSWIEGKNFVMNVMGFPEKEATYAQKWQMMKLSWNVKALAMNTSFSTIEFRNISNTFLHAPWFSWGCLAFLPDETRLSRYRRRNVCPRQHRRPKGILPRLVRYFHENHHWTQHQQRYTGISSVWY